MPRAPKTEADLRAWEAKKGFRGVIFGGQIFRKCVECDQPTLSLDETHCPKDGGKRQVRVRSECQVEGCTNRANRPRARCARLLGRGGPGGARLPRVPEAAQVPLARRRAVRPLRKEGGLRGQARGKARGASATVRRRGHRGRPRRRQGRRLPHALRRAQREGRPQAVHDGADRRRVAAARAPCAGASTRWSLPPARPTCTAACTAAASARTGGGGTIAWSATRTSRSAPIAARGALASDCFQQTDEARRARPLPDVRGGRRRRGGGRGGGPGGEAGAARGQEAEARQAPGAQDAGAARACRLR